ncbi:MAG: methyltransferase domain-containing protein [candidate division Zixibacteria bacterium]
MKISNNLHDAYGQEIYDYFKGNKTTYEIVEREDGYIDISVGPSYYFAEYKKWPPSERKAIRFARGKVLDIGCGAGRVMLYLKDKGCDVYGIDNSPLAVKVCKARGLKKISVMAFNKLTAKFGTFDTITMFGNNFGLFGSYNCAKRRLKLLYRMTTEKGRIIATTCDPYGTKLPYHLAYHKYNRQRGRMSGQIKLRVRYLNYRTPWFDYLLVSPKELKDILKDTGWHIKKLLDPIPPIYTMCIGKRLKIL